MRRRIGMKDRVDVGCACVTDQDRDCIVTKGGRLPANHYMAAMVDDLFRNRPQWSARAAVGKTVVSSSMIDRVAARLDRRLYETPVGFKWFADGLFDGSLGLGGEESAGASFLRRDGSVWTTDKDGMAPALFAAELTARHGHDPAEHYRGLCDAFGEVFFDRVDAPADRSEEHTSALPSLMRISYALFRLRKK